MAMARPLTRRRILASGAGPGRIYRLNEGVLLDAALFQRLRIRGDAHGPAGVKDLRAALRLVRGEPLAGANRPYAAHTRNRYTWLSTSDVDPEDLKSAIVDVAHRMATLCLDLGDINGARWAVAQACLADPAATATTCGSTWCASNTTRATTRPSLAHSPR
jgi:hypothetical protein